MLAALVQLDQSFQGWRSGHCCFLIAPQRILINSQGGKPMVSSSAVSCLPTCVESLLVTILACVCVRPDCYLSFLSSQFIIVSTHVIPPILIALCLNFRDRHGITNYQNITEKIYHLEINDLSHWKCYME